MPILNYTTNVEVEKTQGEVITALRRRGVTRISTLFDDDGNPAGLGFTMKTDYGLRDFELPVRVAGVLTALRGSAESGELSKIGVSPSKIKAYTTSDHAGRVAWRIAKDWLEAQAALIDAQLATLDEVMMPYMVDGRGNTMYSVYRESQLAIEA